MKITLENIENQIINIEECFALLKDSLKNLVVEDQPVNAILKKLESIQSEISNSNLEKLLPKIGDRWLVRFPDNNIHEVKIYDFKNDILIMFEKVNINISNRWIDNWVDKWLEIPSLEFIYKTKSLL